MTNNASEWPTPINIPKKFYEEEALICEIARIEAFNHCLSIFNRLRAEGEICVVPDTKGLAKFISDYETNPKYSYKTYQDLADAIIARLKENK